MSSNKIGFKQGNLVVYFFVIATWLAYAALTLLSPHKGATSFNLTATQTTELQLTIILPMLAIWLVATFGALRFRRYAETIKSSPDGAAALDISNGLLVLVAYLIISTAISSIASYAVGTDLVWAAVAIHNHLPIVIALVAFALTFRGSSKLVALSGKSIWSNRRIILFLIPFCVFSFIFTWAFYLNADPHGLTLTGLPNFALSTNTLLFTFVLPYLVVWLLGCLTSLNIRSFAKSVKGSIYRSALFNLVLGIISVVILTILLQLMTTFSTFNRLNLASLLLVVYFIIIFEAVGYVLIAMGAKKLSRIEEAQ